MHVKRHPPHDDLADIDSPKQARTPKFPVADADAKLTAGASPRDAPPPDWVEAAVKKVAVNQKKSEPCTSAITHRATWLG